MTLGAAAAPPLLSVVVPAYNVEEYLADCLRSICDQTFTALEVIVVDDGSTDGSLAIARAFAQQDSRLTVISVPNGGVSRARNAGLKASRGTYVTFVDADDWVEPGMYEDLMRPTTEHPYDAVAGDLVIESVRGGRDVERAQIAGGGYDVDRIKAEIWPLLVSSDHLTRDWPYRLVTKLYRREHLLQHDLRFVPELRAAQDFVFSVAAMVHARSFFYAKGTSGYHYRWNPTSRTRSSLSSAWHNYRVVDEALQGSVPSTAPFPTQLRLAELHGDLSALTYVYKNCRLRDSRRLYGALTDHLSRVDREQAFEALDWARVPVGKRVICSLMRRRRYRTMHSLLLLRGFAQTLQARRSSIGST